MFDVSVPKSLLDKTNTTLLAGMLRGVEREALRVDLSGTLAQTSHPPSLGSALTHPQITTDFSEALLEFITPPTHQVDDLFSHLTAVQKFTALQLSDELLWATSMPCFIGDENQIPVAQYGSSNNGKMKTIYRVGLGHRYGRPMQTVAGVHYNFSLPNAFWALLSREQNSITDLQTFKDESYFKLIRNFRRHYWLLIYLFGASPALCKSFVSNTHHKLEELKDGHTLYLPYATSLRMGDLGYQSSVQEDLYVCYNDKDSYMKTLCEAITRAHPPYQAIGLKNDAGDFLQLNTNVLQIENEFYSAIRPKRTSHPGETALAALRNRGVEYIEVRCIDVNPFDPLGFTREQVHFLDTFLLYCALQSSPRSDTEESDIILRNQKRIVNFGRQPDLELELPSGGKLSVRDWGLNLIENMQVVAELLDSCQHTDVHQQSLAVQKNKILDSSKTPSARVLRDLEMNEISFFEQALSLAKQHTAGLRETPLSEIQKDRMMHMAEESLREREALEEASTEDFDGFIKHYYTQYSTC